MGNESLNFKNNACAIDVNVAGSASQASGFVYRTNPSCHYDYVLTVKHAFQEENENPKVEKLDHLCIKYSSDEQEEIRLYNETDIKSCFMFFENLDLTIIRIKKQYYSTVKRIAVKNAIDTELDNTLQANAFITIYRKESTKLLCEWKDIEQGIFTVDKIKNIIDYSGASGSGIYYDKEPFLIGLIASYRLPDFEQNELLMVKPDWNQVNEVLKNQNWTILNNGNAPFTAITEDHEVIDLRELNVNGAVLNMEVAIKKMRHDLVDDWFFDPLHYVDMCNSDFVLNFFCKKDSRIKYKPTKMETFYLPKKTFVLRKAMVGTFVDRLVYMAVVEKLGKLIDSHLSCYVFSARYNTDDNKPGLIVQGVEQWTKMNYLINEWVEEGKGCLVKLDLLNYYDTINKKTLIRLLKEIVQTENDKSCVNLLQTLLDGFADKENNHGLPQNSDSSSLLATFYVCHIDEIILSKALHYCRFMDDMYFVANDIYEARDLLQDIEKNLRQIDLSLNAQKIKFVQLEDEKKRGEFVNELSLYDHEKSKIKSLLKCSSKSRRMNAIALLVNQLNIALNPQKDENDDEKGKALKFSTHVFSSLHLNLDSDWDSFFKNLVSLTERQKDTPESTPLICRLISSINRNRDITDINSTIKNLLLRRIGSIYEWQAYHLWMLMAFLNNKDKELENYALKLFEQNDETKRVEIAAIIIYLVTINHEFSRMILHRLRDKLLHGNLQFRCALIALRLLDHNVLDDEVRVAIGNDSLCLSHKYLFKHKDKPLVFFHQISSFLMEHKEPLFPEYYSGL